MSKLIAILALYIIHMVAAFGIGYYIMTVAWGVQLQSTGAWIFGTILTVVNTLVFTSLNKLISESDD